MERETIKCPSRFLEDVRGMRDNVDTTLKQLRKWIVQQARCGGTYTVVGTQDLDALPANIVNALNVLLLEGFAITYIGAKEAKISWDLNEPKKEEV